MKEILYAWLKNDVNIFVDFDELPRDLMDGMLFIRVLKHYDAINVNSIKNVFPSDDIKVCKNNLAQLKIWFKLIEVKFDDDDIDKILKGNTSVCYNVLYQLFLVLKKNQLHLVSKQKERIAIQECKRKFKVRPSTDLSKIKLRNTGLIQEYKDKIRKKKIIEWRKEKQAPEERKQRSCNHLYSNLHITSDNEITDEWNRIHKPVDKNRSVLPEFNPPRKHAEDYNYVKYELCNFKQISALDKCAFKSCGVNRSKINMNDNTNNLYFNKRSGFSFLPPISPKQVSDSVVSLHFQEYIQRVKNNTGILCKSRTNLSFSASVLKDTCKHLADQEKSQLKGVIFHRLIKQSCYEKDMALKFVSIAGYNKLFKQVIIDFDNCIKKIRKSTKSSVNVPNSNILSEYTNKHETRSKDDSCGGDYHKRRTYKNFSSSYLNGPGQRYIDSDHDAYCLSEKKRTVDLHRKLYAEKVKLRYERNYAICYETLEDVVDLAIKRSEFKKQCEIDVLEHIWEQWKYLFHNSQPIFNILSDIEEYLFPEDADAFLVVLERTRQDVVNDVELEFYLKATECWDFFDQTESGHNKFNNSKNKILHESQYLLGYIVHKMLKTKYPLPPSPTPAEIPKYPIVAVVHNIDDMEAVNNFRNLLSKADILVVDVNTAVNFCLQCFKDDITREYNIFQDMESGYGYSYDAGKPEMLYNAQTSCESNIFNTRANTVRLGRSVFKSMATGNEVPFATLVEIMIEYIKQHQDGIKGWVAVNVPSSLYQASVLEHALSGRKFPFYLEDDAALINGSDFKVRSSSRALQSVSTLSNLDGKVTSSRIVPNLKKHDEKDVFKSYFSMYVTTVKGSECEEPDTPEQLLSMFNHQCSSLLLEQPEREGVPTLYNFYHAYGIAYDFIYEKFDSNTLKQLAQLILLYFVENDKIHRFSDGLFGDDILHGSKPSVQLKWYHSVASSDESSSFDAIKSSSISLSIEEQAFITDSNNEDSILNKPEEIKGGYVDYPILENAITALATVWESLESVYLNVLKQTFFLRRNTFYATVPYVTHILRMLMSYWNRVDPRQRLVTKFLDAYNNIYQNLRSDIQMKNELHLRVMELKGKLINLCKERHAHVEKIFKLMRIHNLLYIDLSVYTYYCEILLQAEFDRYIRTLNFLQDYYLAMLGIYKSKPLQEVKIPTHKVYLDINSESEFGNQKNEEKEKISEGPIEEDHRFYLKFLYCTLNEKKNLNATQLFTDIVEKHFSLDGILRTKKLVDKMINNEEEVALKKHKADVKSFMKENKESNDYFSTVNLSVVNSAKEAEIKKLFVEWREAVNSEHDRLIFRIALIKIKLNSELDDIETFITNKDNDVHTMLKEKYENEVIPIDNLCMLFQTAIEEHTPINAQIILNKDYFYIIKNPEEPEEPDVTVPSALEELLSEESFTIKQLEAMSRELMVVAPEGIITQVAFMTFLDSIISYSYSLDNAKMVPNIWRDLSKQEIKILCFELFGDFSIIEWRDFLIYCLDLPYPLTEDMVDARLQFLKYDLKETELISYENYMNTTLWFQRELPESPLQALRNVLAKEFLFSLFNIGNSIINYMSLLLAFCKDKDPKVGFGKALSLLVGKCIIVYKADLYLEKILSDNINTGVKVVNGIITEMLDSIIDNAMSNDRDELPDSKKLSFRTVFNKLNIETSATPKEPANPSKDGVVLAEEMYHEFFRRHLFLQWSSKVPIAAITALLHVTFFTSFNPDYVFLHFRLLETMKKQLAKFKDDDVFVPDFLDTNWFKLNLDSVHKFHAISITDIIKEMISERK